jgi:hypothetical protein
VDDFFVDFLANIDFGEDSSDGSSLGLASPMETMGMAEVFEATHVGTGRYTRFHASHVEARNLSLLNRKRPQGKWRFIQR